MELWKKIIWGTVLALAGGYLVFSLLFFRTKRQEQTCRHLRVEITDRKSRQFATDEEIRQFIVRQGINPEGSAISEQRCHQIEEAALQHPMVRTATCYPTPGGDIVVRLTQREPKIRIMGADNYYVDADRRIMQVRSTTAADVPIITGHVSQRMAQEELFDFCEWLEDDDFWTAQVEQIHVAGPSRIELVPRVGSGIIILGSLKEYEGKLRKLKVLYQKGFSRFGWKEYKEIDLRFKGQVVCR
ncbi:MAG: hypothetical protein KBS77_07845 [Bacteroidales bacterium]|nr:hypothetical protein [Candidatus Colicola faecequi]